MRPFSGPALALSLAGLAPLSLAGLMPLALADTPLTAVTIEVFDAADADQGVAVDAEAFYAVDNSVIAKHDRRSGALLERWEDDTASIAHLNSCVALDGTLECANSNYPSTPMASSVEVFESRTLKHVSSHGLGVTDAGSLVWTDRTSDGRIAGFAHYGKRGGEPFKDSHYSSVVLFDEAWRRMGGYAFPPAVTARMAPYAASGGAIGPDGFLYVMGHDLPEMYVLGKPARGPYLVHVATIGLEAEGQAFSFDPLEPRAVWVIDRRQGKVRRLRLPDVAAKEGTLRFEQ